MLEFFSAVWSWIVSFVTSYRLIIDTVDIALVAFVIYSLIKLVRDSRAEQLLKGLLLMAVAYMLSSPNLLDLKAIHYMLNIVVENGLIVLVVIFQPEIRRALERAGYSRFNGRLGLFGLGGERSEQLVQQWHTAISAVCGAAELLQRQRMGALIVFERNTKLGDIVKTGTTVNADPSVGLIGNVFFNKAPLHDGAMILRDGKVLAAGCILPLSEKAGISRELGTRHRAGLGMSENSDALVVIVSEETGTISLAIGGELQRDFTPESLRVALENGILWSRGADKGDDKRRGWLKRRKNQ
ncbi:MAG: diadenylate cyclase CdaA [Acutalibacteraceae bacterium]|jgi:diadenylate cyclase